MDILKKEDPVEKFTKALEVGVASGEPKPRAKISTPICQKMRLFEEGGKQPGRQPGHGSVTKVKRLRKPSVGGQI